MKSLGETVNYGCFLPQSDIAAPKFYCKSITDAVPWSVDFYVPPCRHQSSKLHL